MTPNTKQGRAELREMFILASEDWEYNRRGEVGNRDNGPDGIAEFRDEEDAKLAVAAVTALPSSLERIDRFKSALLDLVNDSECDLEGYIDGFKDRVGTCIEERDEPLCAHCRARQLLGEDGE